MRFREISRCQKPFQELGHDWPSLDAGGRNTFDVERRARRICSAARCASATLSSGKWARKREVERAPHGTCRAGGCSLDWHSFDLYFFGCSGMKTSFPVDKSR